MRIGIDLGGTKIEGIALDGEQVLARRRVAAPRDDYDRTVRAVCELVAAIQKETAQTGTVGVGIPGALSAQTGLVKNANSVWLIGRRFDRDLAQALGQEVRVANDANCFALSEATDGAGKGAHAVFGAIIGTGTGAGIVIGGQVLEGLHRIAGEWGHNPLPWPEPGEQPGAACYCGLSGCVETFLSGAGLSRTYAAVLGQGRASGRLRQGYGVPRQNGATAGAGREGPPRQIADASEVAARASGGDEAARTALEIYEGRMARALASVINVLDPDVIVLGGGLSNIERLYDNVPARWAPYVFSDHADTPLVRAAHGDSSGVRGAAWLW